jgi:hypothetical protein
MNDQSVLSIPDPVLWALAPVKIQPLSCPWCGGLHRDGTEILPKLLVVVDEAGDALVLGELADEWCCTGCGHEWDQPVGLLA